MRIYTAENEQLYVNAVSKLANGSNVEGSLYFTQAGIHNGSLQFQRGSPELNGVNGVTDECLIAVLTHRNYLLSKKVPCVENTQIMGSLQLLAEILKYRSQRGKTTP